MKPIEEILQEAEQVGVELEDLAQSLGGQPAREEILGIISDYTKFLEKLKLNTAPQKLPQQNGTHTSYELEERYQRLYSRFLSDKGGINRILMGSQDEVECGFHDYMKDIGVKIDWPHPWVVVVGIDGYSKALAFPRQGAHLKEDYRRWFELPRGINVGIGDTITPAIVDGFGTSTYKLVQQGVVKQ